jgi:hypothetical protein
MSIPRDHHYLPQFYLERWARNGQVFRYRRPRGKDGALEVKRKVPRGIAYQRDLYQLPDIADPALSQQLELSFFQKIDDHAATALQRLDAGDVLGSDDRVALVRFVVSLLHRSPSRLGAIRREIAQRSDAPFQHLTGANLERALKSMANRLLHVLVNSDRAATLLTELVPHRIIMPSGTKTFLTSDRPVSVSAHLVSPDAFMVLPYGPDRIIVFTKIADIVRSFATQAPNVLVKGINGAVVEQAEDLVVAADDHARRMVDRLFLRPQPGTAFDPIGLIRRKAPLIDLTPAARLILRHQKAALKYLGT